MSTSADPKFLQLALDLESAIARGRWQPAQRLPSVRELAKEHSVAMATASRALEVLRGKGVIDRNERTGKYSVARPSRGAGRWALCARVTPGPMQSASIAVSTRAFLRTAQNMEEPLLSDLFDLDGTTTRAEIERDVDAALEEGISGLFLLPSRVDEANQRRDEWLVAACRGRSLPVVLLERNLRGFARPLQHDLVSVDDSQGGYDCARHLMELGKRKLGFVHGCPTSSHNERLGGFLNAHWIAAQEGLIPEPEAFPSVLRFPLGVDHPEAYTQLAERILAEKLDGVVCFQDTVVLGLTLELLHRGHRVPHDIALTGFDDQPLGHAFSLGITSYAYPGEEIARHAFRLMRARVAEPDAPPSRVLVPGRLIVRETTVAQPRPATSGSRGTHADTAP